MCLGNRSIIRTNKSIQKEGNYVGKREDVEYDKINLLKTKGDSFFSKLGFNNSLRRTQGKSNERILFFSTYINHLSIDETPLRKSFK